jgi:hypothetical protein
MKEPGVRRIILGIALLLWLPNMAGAQVLGAPLISTSAAGIISGTNIYAQNISATRATFGSVASTSGGVIFPDGVTQTVAFQRTVTVRTNSPANFSLAPGASAIYTASCNAGEVATGGGCQDGGYEMFYFFQPTASSYKCGWYNTTGTGVTILNPTVYVNCLK